MTPFETASRNNAPLPVTVDDDAEAEVQAQQARDQGTELVREHLRQHLRQNPNSSFVTWIATLHPENASVVIDPRFLTPENPWWTVYEETKVYEDHPTTTRASKSATSASGPTHAGFLDLTIGLLLAVAGAASAFLVEIFALLVHGIAYGFECLTLLCCRQIWSKIMLAWIWFIVWKSLVLTEWILLLSSVLVTEILAGVSFILCTFFGCSIEIGRAAHQRTRRLSHLVRWACRKPFSSSPSQVQLDANVHEIDLEEQQQQQESSVHVAVPTATFIGTVSASTTTTTTFASHPVPTAPVVVAIDEDLPK